MLEPVAVMARNVRQSQRNLSRFVNSERLRHSHRQTGTNRKAAPETPMWNLGRDAEGGEVYVRLSSIVNSVQLSSCRDPLVNNTRSRVPKKLEPVLRPVLLSVRSPCRSNTVSSNRDVTISFVIDSNLRLPLEHQKRVC